MAPSSEAYHVSIGGQGYILVDGSYIRKSQQPFSPRFATGSYSYGDLSFWQFIAQQSWSGGEGQLIFDDTTKFKTSYGWSFVTGKPRLGGGSARLSGLTTFGAVGMLGAVGSTITPHQLLLSHGANASQGGGYALVLIAPVAALTPDGTLTQVRAVTNSLVRLMYANGYCGARITRENNIRHATAVAWRNAEDDHRVYFHSDTGGVLYTETMGSVRPHCIIQINSLTCLIIGRIVTLGVNPPMHLVVRKLTLTAGAWTGAGSNDNYVASSPYQISPYSAIDANGTVYILCIANEATNDSDHGWSSILMYTAAAISGTLDVSEIVPLHNIYAQGLVTINGTVYIIGAEKISSGGSTRWRAAVWQFPNTLVWASETFSTTLTDVLPRSLCQINRAEAMFTDAPLDSELPTRVMQILPGPVIREAYTLRPRTTAYNSIHTALMRCGQTMYLYDAQNNAWDTATSAPGDSRTNTAPLTLSTSEMGSNTPLIQKSLYKIIVDLDTVDNIPIPIGEKIAVYANDIFVGDITADDALRKELVVTSEIVSAGFVIKLVSNGGTWTGAIKRIAIQYIPTQLKKRAWGMAVRVEHNQKLFNDQHDRRLVPEKLADLEAAWKANSPVDYIDTDGVAYKVIITEFSARQPIMTTKQERREYIFSMELLEI